MEKFPIASPSADPLSETPLCCACPESRPITFDMGCFTSCHHHPLRDDTRGNFAPFILHPLLSICFFTNPLVSFVFVFSFQISFFWQPRLSRFAEPFAVPLCPHLLSLQSCHRVALSSLYNLTFLVSPALGERKLIPGKSLMEKKYGDLMLTSPAGCRQRSQTTGPQAPIACAKLSASTRPT